MHPDEQGGANGFSLDEARRNYQLTGFIDPEKEARRARRKLP
jgi:hypothetical protein